MEDALEGYAELPTTVQTYVSINGISGCPEAIETNTLKIYAFCHNILQPCKLELLLNDSSQIYTNYVEITWERDFNKTSYIEITVKETNCINKTSVAFVCPLAIGSRAWSSWTNWECSFGFNENKLLRTRVCNETDEAFNDEAFYCVGPNVTYREDKECSCSCPETNQMPSPLWLLLLLVPVSLFLYLRYRQKTLDDQIESRESQMKPMDQEKENSSGI
uniref:Uncharacterized protein n=1 Tax=Biomphalaria glabrata TaxID=6526 RepID=A0A2C9LEL5_BIOGL